MFLQHNNPFNLLNLKIKMGSLSDVGRASPIEARTFVRGLMAKLGSEGVKEVKLHDYETRERIYAVVNYLTEQLEGKREELNKAGENKYRDPDFRRLLTIRNEIQADNNGWFSNFNALAVSFGYSFSRIGDHGEVILDCSDSSYRHILSRFSSDSERELIESAYEIYTRDVSSSQ